jgi:hypothetical protein
MLRLSSSLLNRPVISLRTGSQIALAETPIINPHNLKILGWWCSGPDGRQVLLAEDLRDSMAEGLAVDNEEALSDPSDLVRHQEVLDVNFELMDKPVRTKRQRLGRVSDYSYNDGMFVQKLYVAMPLRKVFSTDDTLIIDRQQIIEVTDKYIMVRDTEVRAGSDELAGAAVSA